MKRALIAVLIAFSASIALAQAKKSWDKPPEMKIDVNKTYTATIETDKGKIVLTLFPKLAPKTVNSFVFLAREKFFDGIVFHRTIPGFMIQTGDPKGNGTGGPGYEFANENRDSKRGYVAGTVGMANAGPNTNGSQFFISDADSGLPADTYTIFGEVKEGLDVVKAIAKAPLKTNEPREDRPMTPVVMKSVTIEEK